MEKVYRARFKDWQSQRRLSVSRYCQWLGITRQAYYQAEKRAQMAAQATEQILELVMEYRCLMPSIGTRKLYWLIKGKLLQRGLKCGRDQLFKILKEHNLLIRPKRRYTKLRIASIG